MNRPVEWMMILILGMTGVMARADLITPTRVAGNWGITASAEVTNLVNNSGLSGPPYDALSTHSAGVYGNMWLTGLSPATNATVSFDFGTNYDLTGAVIWNDNETGYTGRGFSNFNIYVSRDIAGGYTLVAGSPFTLNRGSGTSTQTAQIISFSASAVRRVKFVELKSWVDDGYVGLSEVKFNGTVSSFQISDTVIAPVTAAASSMLVNPDYSATHLIDGSGLSWQTNAIADAFQDTVNYNGKEWISVQAIVRNQWVVFDLGTNYTIKAVLVWNYNGQGSIPNGAVSNFDIYVSAVGTNGPFTRVGTNSYSLQKAPNAGAGGQFVSFSKTYARAVLFTNLSNYGSGDPDYVGLQEVRFVKTMPPLPGTIIYIH